jgi:hypothetical protein
MNRLVNLIATIGTALYLVGQLQATGYFGPSIINAPAESLPKKQRRMRTLAPVQVHHDAKHPSVIQLPVC